MLAHFSAVTLFAALAAAQVHAPVGNPSGNNITRPLNEIVPACKQFTITWLPSTPNTVSLLLLKGPSSNVLPIATIKERIPNGGSFAWDVPSGLDATTGPTGYGIQLIDDVTGQYQYSTQFGISNQACAGVSSSSQGGYPVYTSTASAKASSASSVYSAIKPSSTAVSAASKASSAMVYSTASRSVVLPPVSSAFPSTGGPLPSSAIIQPTNPITLPSSLIVIPTATSTSPTSAPVQATGAASNMKAGLSLAGAVAGLAYLL